MWVEFSSKILIKIWLEIELDSEELIEWEYRNFFIFVIHLEKLPIFTSKYDIYRSGVSSVSMPWMELRDRVWPGLRYLIISFWTTLFQYDCLIICLGRLWMMSSLKSSFLISSYINVFLWFLLIPIYDLLVSFWRSTSLSDALFYLDLGGNLLFKRIFIWLL